MRGCALSFAPCFLSYPDRIVIPFAALHESVPGPKRSSTSACLRRAPQSASFSQTAKPSRVGYHQLALSARTVGRNLLISSLKLGTLRRERLAATQKLPELRPRCAPGVQLINATAHLPTDVYPVYNGRCGSQQHLRWCGSDRAMGDNRSMDMQRTIQVRPASFTDSCPLRSSPRCH